MSKNFLEEFDIELPTSNDIKQYQILRTIGRDLNTKLVRQLPKYAIEECGKKLGIYKHGTLVIGGEDELSVLMDYCIFHFRRNNVNIVSRYLALSPPDEDSIEMSLLQSMLKSYYSLFVVIGIISGKGLILSDILRNTEIFITDIGLSNSASLRMIFAGNILPIDRFYMTSGAFLPIPDSLFIEKIDLIIDKFYKEDNVLSQNQEAAFSAQVIRIALQAGVIENMNYKNV